VRGKVERLDVIIEQMVGDVADRHSHLVDHGRNESRYDQPPQPRVIRRVGKDQAGLDKGIHVSQQV
jgi:hypothetical protein